MRYRCSLFKLTLTCGFIWLVALAYFHYTTSPNLESFDEIESDEKFGENIKENFKKFENNFKKFERKLNKDEEVEMFFGNFKPKKNESFRKSPKFDNFVAPKLSDKILNLHKTLNLTNPGHLGAPVVLPKFIPHEIRENLNKSWGIYKINEFVSRLIPLDRELPDYRPEFCKTLKYEESLPKVSVILVFLNEPLSVILRTVFSILKRTSEDLLEEILLVDDASTYGKLKFEIILI